MKYFSLFSGKQVHPAPGQKIIPKDEFSTLQEAAEIVALAKEEAEQFRKETATEMEKIKEKAAKAGEWFCWASHNGKNVGTATWGHERSPITPFNLRRLADLYQAGPGTGEKVDDGGEERGMRCTP